MGGTPSNPAAFLSKQAQNIRKEVREHPLVVYTKDQCGYCVMAKDELNQDGIEYVEKNLNEKGRTDPAGVEEYVKGLMELTRQRTVPQIFVCGKFIGGYTEMHAKRANLPDMLRECSVGPEKDTGAKPKL